MKHEVRTYINYEDCECGGEFTEVDEKTLEVINKEVVGEVICNKCGKRKLSDITDFGEVMYYYKE